MHLSAINFTHPAWSYPRDARKGKWETWLPESPRSINVSKLHLKLPIYLLRAGHLRSRSLANSRPNVSRSIACIYMSFRHAYHRACLTAPRELSRIAWSSASSVHQECPSRAWLPTRVHAGFIKEKVYASRPESPSTTKVSASFESLSSCSRRFEFTDRVRISILRLHLDVDLSDKFTRQITASSLPAGRDAPVSLASVSPLVLKPSYLRAWLCRLSLRD